jgi:hypothetical protein
MGGYESLITNTKVCEGATPIPSLRRRTERDVEEYAPTRTPTTRASQPGEPSQSPRGPAKRPRGVLPLPQRGRPSD